MKVDKLSILYLAVAVCGWLLFVWAATGDAPPTGWTTKAKVVRVIDGDTVEVEIKRRMTVRLLDCWAPESRTRDLEEKKRGLESKARMEELVGGKPVTLHVPTTENLAKLFTFGRVLGRIWVNDRDVSEALVEEGFATKEKP